MKKFFSQKFFFWPIWYVVRSKVCNFTYLEKLQEIEIEDAMEFWKMKISHFSHFSIKNFLFLENFFLTYLVYSTFRSNLTI